MRALAALAAAAATAATAATAAPASAQAGGGSRLAFVDERTLRVDLDRAGAPVTVRVVNIDPARTVPHLSLLVLGLAPGTLAVAPARGVADVAPGEVVAFTLEADTAAGSGSGQLVALGSDGALARREVAVVKAAIADDDLDALHLTAQRIWPLGQRFEVNEVEVAGLPGERNPPGEIAFLTAESGDVARLFRQGARFGVTQLDGPGEYTGTVDLRPDAEGGELAVTLRVRDVAAWPLAVLLVGLGLASLLDRFAKKERPQDLFEQRLAGLLREADANAAASAERLAATLPGEAVAVYRIARAGTGPPLLLDTAAQRAFTAWRTASEDAVRDQYLPTGERWKELEGHVRSHAEVLACCERLAEAVVDVRRRAPGEAAAAFSLSGTRVLRPTRGLLAPERPELAAPGDLAGLPAAARGELARLDELAGVQRLLLDVAGRAGGELGRRAEEALGRLPSAAPDLTEAAAEARRLDEEASAAAALAALRAGAPAPPAGPEAAEPVPAPAAAVPAGAAAVPAAADDRAGRWRLVGAGCGVVVVLAVLVGLVVPMGSDDRATDTGLPVPPPAGEPVGGGGGGGGGSGADGAPSPALPRTGPGLAPGPGSPRAGGRRTPPTTVATQERLADDGAGGASRVLNVGVVVALLGAVATWVWSALRRRPGPRVEVAIRTPEQIEREVRVERMLYGLLGSVLVVLSGMAVLYVPNATFGTAGDYLTVLLWGTGVGEGVKLARRLVPGAA